MASLFNEGFRLARLEIYNWGTFDNEIWVMTPERQTAVLTGANGSGKSTVVDALLTLLVDSRQRNYNLASGAGSTRERSERTYIRGHYSRSRGDSAIEAKPNSLRDHNDHSVLLAVFHDEAQNRTVTLAQVLWISNAERVEKRYYVAPCELSIEQNFPQRHIAKRDLPKEVEVFSDSFKDYIVAVRKALGLGGRPKALDLFNQTVAVKDIASLNTFVREHMLDKGSPEEKVNGLREQYRELNEAYASIQRASKQIQILTPLMKAGSDYLRYDEQIIRYDAARTLVPFYVANRARDLLTEAIKQTESLREAEASRLEAVDKDIATQRESLERVRISIAQDNVGQEKREIEGKLSPLKREIEALQRAAKKYDEYAQVIDLVAYSSEDHFYQNRAQGEDLRQQFIEAKTELEQQQFEVKTEQQKVIARGKELDKEVQHLRAHPSSIPEKVARIRLMICEALDIPVEKLPFVGELLKVRDEEHAWEGALERLLNGFAQELIVPEALYHKVGRYVNQNNLGGRLVYRRVDPDQASGRLPERHAGEMAYDKLQILEKTPYRDWLAANLMQKFAYVCCETMDEFQREERALTAQGQIKHNASRHEKDDRRALSDRRYYVLGWDNREKLRQLERELDDLSRHLTKLGDKLTKIGRILEHNQREISAIDNLLNYRTFDEIDWRTPQTEYDRLYRRLEELNRSSHNLQQLEKQRDTLQEQVKETERRRDKITGELRSLNDRIEGYQRRLEGAQGKLASFTQEQAHLWEQVGSIIEEIDKEPLTIDTLNNRTNELEVFIQRSIANFKGQQNKFEAVILDAMNNFKREYPDEGASLTADIESLAAFESLYGKLQTDDLPRHEARFKEMLDRTVSRGVQVFYSYLTEQERQIERSIGELNDSLAKVDYGGKSTIRLIAERTPEPEINGFQRDLRDCFIDAGDNSDEERNRAYRNIKALIDKFDQDPNWMRRVIDVRRWRVFAAERIDVNGIQLEYYSDSSGKSGGQKAKLAYTILASAIAHQYGLQDSQSNDRTFRFVVIDEAFSKLDDENARFAMQLFEHLGLQLLVVTPMQQLHVIEKYVNAYHVVVNNNEGNYSRLFNLTQAEYIQRRREFMAERA